MYKFFYFAAIVFLFSCKEKAKQDKEQAITMTEPSKIVIDSLVKDWYDQIPVKPGGPSRQIDSVQVLDMNKETPNDSVYHLTFVASGTETNYSLPDPPTSRFSDTGRIDIAWRNSGWEALNKPHYGN